MVLWIKKYHKKTGALLDIKRAQAPIHIPFFSSKLATHNALLGYRNSPCWTPCVIFGSKWPISHCDPPSYCDNFTQYKNKVKHFLLTFRLSQTPHIAKVKIKVFLFVFVLGKVVATQRWFVVNLRVMWPEGSTRVNPVQQFRDPSLISALAGTSIVNASPHIFLAFIWA